MKKIKTNNPQFDEKLQKKLDSMQDYFKKMEENLRSIAGNGAVDLTMRSESNDVIGFGKITGASKARLYVILANDEAIKTCIFEIPLKDKIRLIPDILKFEKNVKTQNIQQVLDPHNYLDLIK